MSAFSYLFQFVYAYHRCWVMFVLVQPDTEFDNLSPFTSPISIFSIYIGIYGVGKHFYWLHGDSLLNAFDILLDAIIPRYLLNKVYTVCPQVVLPRPFMLRLSLRRNY